MNWHQFGFHITEFWQGMIKTGSWLLAFVWVLRTYEVVYRLPALPDLTMVDWDTSPQRASALAGGPDTSPQRASALDTQPPGMPSLTVVVPARDEADKIGATLDALMMADYAGVQVLVIDDRSTDGTAEIVDRYVEEFATRRPGALRAIHLTELPEGWLGKTFALMVATENSATEYLLFTDADVLFSPSVLRRALVYAQYAEADHVVVAPTLLVKSWGEGIVLGFLQVLGIWALRPWKVEDPRARRDVIGVGAFNLVRRDALEEIGGWLPQRLAVLEDVTLGRRMKAAGMRQRFVFAPGMVLVHWASGARGLLRNMTKNLFSAVNFQPLLALLVLVWIGVFCLLPLAGLAWLPTVVPALIILCCIGATYRVTGAMSRIDARYAWLYPLGAVAMMFAMLRSMVVVLAQRGVVWRGTRYPLRDLRKHNSPFVWERAARKQREEEIKARRRAKKHAAKGKGSLGE